MPLFGDCTDEECTTNEIMKFIAENFIYPEISKLDGVEGRVIAEFVVEKDGKVGRVKILSGVDEHIDKAVIEVIKKLPRFTPGKQLGKPVAVKYTLPVKCTIDDEDFISTFPLVGAKYSTNFDGKSWVGIDVTIFSITDEISGKKMDMFVFGYSRTINNETNLMDGHINDFSFELGKYRYAGPFLYTSIYQFGFMNIVMFGTRPEAI